MDEYMQFAFPLSVQSNSPEQTEALGASLAAQMQENASLPRFVALYGDLGVGKTAFVRGFARVLAPESTVKSPTFALVNEYGSKKSRVYHFDMYRIIDDDDLYSTGFYDYLSSNAFCIVEWSEKIPFALPNEYIKIVIEKISVELPNERLITISVQSSTK